MSCKIAGKDTNMHRLMTKPIKIKYARKKKNYKKLQYAKT